MCRFLLAKSKSPFDPKYLLKPFSEMAEKSRAFDGDWQGDGWGYSWLDEHNNWKSYTSLNPIWKDFDSIHQTQFTKIVLIHARSASFPHHKDHIEFNQPFVTEPYAYVFNGLLKGVSLSLPGIIGAQKIWNLLKIQLKRKKPKAALQKTIDVLLASSKNLQAANFGFSDKQDVYAQCFYSNHESYYQLHIHTESSVQFICSEPLKGFSSLSVSTNQIIKL